MSDIMYNMYTLLLKKVIDGTKHKPNGKRSEPEMICIVPRRRVVNLETRAR